MAGAGELPLLVASTIHNIKIYHVIMDGGAGLNLISLAMFNKMQILFWTAALVVVEKLYTLAAAYE